MLVKRSEFDPVVVSSCRRLVVPGRRPARRDEWSVGAKIAHNLSDPPGQLSVYSRAIGAYFDLQAFAPRVTATTLLMAGASGSLLDAQTLVPLVRALPSVVTVHASEHSSYKDGLYAEQWMAEQCGIPEVQRILPERWR